MNIIEIITKKKDSKELSYEEIKYAVEGFVNGNIKDYQMSSLLMAIVINGMNMEETNSLTKVMIESGDSIDLSSINGIVVDKHSTGGVGDKTTLVLAPLLATTDLKVAKMSGKGLGHTGGTIDKLESIQGFNTQIEEKLFVKQVNEIGCAIISQTTNLVPADKKMYALRDVTGTTESIPLIASSIMSKKIASGAKIIIIDVKVGNGALMKNIESAKALADSMINIGKNYNVKVICVLTNMDEPLGYAIGNGLEVLESINTLKGKGPKDLEDLVITLGSLVLSEAKGIDKIKAKNILLDNINSGVAYNKLKDMVSSQNGNIENIKISDKFISIKSSKDGFITGIDTLKLGELARLLGAGRLQKEDSIDYGVGFVLDKKIGDFVLENEELLKIYYDNKNINVQDVVDCFKITPDSCEIPKLILEIIK